MNNRPIKFRVWNNVQKLWVDSDQVGISANGNILIFDRQGGSDSIWSLDCWNGNRIYKVQQFTGLTDSTGKEVYEGDILEYKRDSAFGNIFYDRMVVEWEVCGDGFGVLNCGFRMGGDYAMKELTKIVGNLFETPELLA